MSVVSLVKVSHRNSRLACVHPLGILYLAAALREARPGRRDLRLHDMNLRRETPEEALAAILRDAPDVVGLSAMTHDAQAAHALARGVKAALPRTAVILGGPYAEGDVGKILANPAVDYVVVGEGERAFVRLTRDLEEGNRETSAPGVAYRRGAEIVANPPAPPMTGEELDALPFPAWDLIDPTAYFDVPRFGATYARREYMTLFTSRGCPYLCTYCHTIFGKRMNAHAPERVLAEIDAFAARYGLGELCVVDDIFNFDEARALAIAEKIVARGYDLRIEFPAGLRADRMSRELLAALRRAGTYRLCYAIETAAPRLQRATRKNVDLEKMRRAIAWTDELGIACNGFFMLGFPGETREEMEATVRWALGSRLHSANFFLVNPLEGTALGREAGEAANDGAEDTAGYFARDRALAEAPPREIAWIARRALLRFHARPRRIWRLLRLYPNKAQLPALALVVAARSVGVLISPGEKRRLLAAAARLALAWTRWMSRLFPPGHRGEAASLAARPSA